MPTIPSSKYSLIKKMYDQGATMDDIATHFNVSLNAVVYAMRKGTISRRSFQKVQALRFARKTPSFKVRALRTARERAIELIGLSLYWAEGYKTEKASGVDFANSDSDMIRAFIVFLRMRYALDEKRFRVLLYCYSDQRQADLIAYWSQMTKIPKSQFSKPYIRKDFRKNGRKMPRGLIHIRYADKKLLYDILGRIDRLRATV